MNRLVRVFSILLVGLPISAAFAQDTPGASTPATDSTMTLSSGGVERSYVLHLPPGYSGRAIGLVLNFHGSGGVPANQMATSGFNAIADREDFAVAYPAGVFQNGVSRQSWNANLDEGVDDVQFARDVIADVTSKVDVDGARIYATGFSGGARMTSRLACELADTLAAAAPVAGLQYPDDCVPARAIPIVAFHGRPDPVNPFELTSAARPYWRMGVETAAEKWRRADRCEDEVQSSAAGKDVELRVWPVCASRAEIDLYISETDGHVWPEGASERIWAFFSAHPR